jgi:hypothetical protein
MIDITDSDAGPSQSRSMREREALFGALAALPDELQRTLQGHSPESLTRPASDGGWGVVENLCHLRDWEEVFLERAHAIVEQERPLLPAYDDELWSIERDYRGQDPTRTLGQFRELRTRLMALLTGLDQAAWSRIGQHASFGEISLHWLANHICDHGEEHLQQIRDALG